MKYLVKKSFVDVIGYIWMPHNQICSYRYDLSIYDIEIIKYKHGEITRATIEDWLSSHAGDFSSIEDFKASIEDGDETLDFGWAKGEESEMKYQDTFPDEECDD